MSRKTRVERSRKPQAQRAPMSFEERVALFVGTVHRERAGTLLEGFKEPQRLRAAVFVEQLKQVDSAQRQAQLAHAFGVRPDALERLQALVASSSGALRGAVIAALSPGVRQQLALTQAAAAEVSPALRAVASRLVREASRGANG